MQIIDELEPVKRGGYGGAIGCLSYTGDLDTCIHIRTVVVKDGVAHVQAGGGTVADAKPDYEYEESRGQGARPCWRAIELAVRRQDGLGTMTRVLVVDNYDSFTYNLVQYLGELGAELEVVRNDARDGRRAARARPRPRRRLARARARPTRPGSRSRSCARFPEAGRPDARRLPRPPVAGAGVRRRASSATSPSTARRPRSSTTARTIFAGLPSPLTVGRYHSLVVDAESCPDCFEVTRARRRRGDGHAPPRAAGRGRPVPPRVGADARGQAAAARTSSSGAAT